LQSSQILAHWNSLINNLPLHRFSKPFYSLSKRGVNCTNRSWTIESNSILNLILHFESTTVGMYFVIFLAIQQARTLSQKFDGGNLKLLPVITDARDVIPYAIYTYFYTPLMIDVHPCQRLQCPYIPICYE